MKINYMLAFAALSLFIGAPAMGMDSADSPQREQKNAPNTRLTEFVLQKLAKATTSKPSHFETLHAWLKTSSQGDTGLFSPISNWFLTLCNRMSPYLDRTSTSHSNLLFDSIGKSPFSSVGRYKENNIWQVRKLLTWFNIHERTADAPFSMDCKLLAGGSKYFKDLKTVSENTSSSETVLQDTYTKCWMRTNNPEDEQVGYNRRIFCDTSMPYDEYMRLSARYRN